MDIGATESPAPEARYSGSALLAAIAQIDSFDSHGFLVAEFENQMNIHWRADVLEAMAFEPAMFDEAFVVRRLGPETPEPMLLSALYALTFHFTILNWDDVRNNVVPLLKNSSPHVRGYAVELLGYSTDFSTQIAALANDPDPHVRRYVAEPLTIAERLSRT